MRPVAAALAAQNPLARPDPFVGVFQGDQVVLDLKGAAGQYTGTLTVNGTSLATTVKSAGASATGTFAASGTSYSYTLTPAGRGFVLNSEGNEYCLERKSESPATPAAPAGSIVGYWRNSTGYARFNADGTGVIDGNPGRYEIRGNQLALIRRPGTTRAALRSPRRCPHPDGEWAIGNSEPHKRRGRRRRHPPRVGRQVVLDLRDPSAAGRAPIQPMCNLESERHLPLRGPDGQLQP